MKYKTIQEFLEAAKSGELAGVTVTVDNDSIYAYKYSDTDDGDDEKVFDFNDAGPQQALVELLQAIGIEAEYP